MNGPTIGSKPFREFQNYRNAEASASIDPGRPVVLVLNGTEDGFEGVLPSTATATQSPFLFAGVNSLPTALVADAYGMAQISGLCNYALVAQQTRSASGASWSTAAALSIGQPLTINTVANAFVAAAAAGVATVTYVTGTATSDTLGLTLGNIFLPYAVLAATTASAAASASTTSDTRLAITYGMKVYLRAM
jgi:hypothetical protein